MKKELQRVAEIKTRVVLC